MSNSDIEAVAAEWLAKLDRRSEPDLEAKFKRWRAEDPRHEVAYLRLKAVSHRLERLQSLRPPSQDPVDPDFLAASCKPPSPESKSSLRSPRLRYLLAAGLAGLIAGATYLVQWHASDDYFRTGIGGFERVVLTDGSVVELNTNTEIRVSFDKKHRRVGLITGEATFDDAHDPRRPFIVEAGDDAVRALGTQFDVRRETQGLHVVVTSGRVAVDRNEFADGGVPLLSRPKIACIVVAGQAAQVSKGEVNVRTESRQEVERDLAWHDGMLMFDSAPLEEVAAEFNRYNRRQLVIADPRIARLDIGGYFKSTNLDTFVQVLRSSFGVAAETKGSEIILRPSDSRR